MTDTQNSQLSTLLEGDQYLNIPELGALIEATVLSIKGREVRLDVNGLTTGVVRGRELFTEGGTYGNLKRGDKVEATVLADATAGANVDSTENGNEEADAEA